MIGKTRMVALLLVLATALAACSPASEPSTPPADTKAGAPAAQPKAGGTLTRAMTSEPASLDPQGAATAGLSLTAPYLFDTLVTRRADGKIAPHLAEDWQVSPDGKTIDMQLKKNVKFHDGTPMNAEAVVFTFERFKATGDKSPIAGSIKQISKIEAVEELKVRFSLDKPNAAILGTLAMPYAGIVSPGSVQAAGEDWGTKPVGTGPFKLGEWKRGVSITLDRNPDYNWGPAEAKNRGPVHIDKLVYKLIPDAATQVQALQTGEVDAIFINDPSHMAALEKDKGVKLQPINLDSLIYLGYHTAKAPFDEVEVRQALSHAVNKEQIIKLALGGMGMEANALVHPSLLGYSDELKAHGQEFDPEKSRELLKKAGFTQTPDGGWERGGKKLEGKLLTSTRSPNDVIATVIQSQMKAIGVPVEIQQLDSAAVTKATTEGAFDLLLWRYDWFDPDGLNVFLSTERIRQTNRVFYSNKQVDELFQKGLAEYDAAKRAPIYVEAQKILLAESPWQPLYHPMEGLATRNGVEGIVIGSMGRLLVNDITVSGN
jgi:peptide/nickel transport system substrate-binding protein